MLGSTPHTSILAISTVYRPTILDSFLVRLEPNVFADGNSTGFGIGAAALSDTGSVLAVAAEDHNNTRGAVFVFSCAGGSCGGAQIITLGDDGMPGDVLGQGMALSGASGWRRPQPLRPSTPHPPPHPPLPRAGLGTVLAAGAPGRNNNTGAVFTCSCAAGVCGVLNQLVLPGGASGDLFGNA